eukprot:COSAG06_NODE_16391_length_1003_cov_464.508850_2_plen_72_part_01
MHEKIEERLLLKKTNKIFNHSFDETASSLTLLAPRHSLLVHALCGRSQAYLMELMDRNSNLDPIALFALLVC